jgi:actin-like protein 6A
MLCGDEVASIIVDMGSSTCKFGTAGQESPRHVFRSEVGVRSSEATESTSSSSGDEVMNVEGAEKSKDPALTNYVIGDSALRVARDSIEVSRPFQNGGMKIVHFQKLRLLDYLLPELLTYISSLEINWDIMEQLFSYGTESCMRVDTSESPVMFAENYFATDDDKVKVTLLFIESYHAS